MDVHFPKYDTIPTYLKSKTTHTDARLLRCRRHCQQWLRAALSTSATRHVHQVPRRSRTGRSMFRDVLGTALNDDPAIFSLE